MKTLILASTCLAIASITTAQEGIESDRPDQTESVYVLDKGKLQLETGMLYDFYGSDSDPLIGQAMIRYGVTDKMELRLLVEEGKERDLYMEEAPESVYPLSISSKLSIIEGHSWLPDFTLVGYVKLPFTSHSSEQRAYWSPSLIAAFKNKLTQNWSVEYNAGVKQDAFSKNISWAGSCASQHELSDALEIFVEYFGQYERSESPVHNVDAGLLFKFRKNMQADISAGTNVLADEANRFVSIGYSVRL